MRFAQDKIVADVYLVAVRAEASSVQNWPERRRVDLVLVLVAVAYKRLIACAYVVVDPTVPLNRVVVVVDGLRVVIVQQPVRGGVYPVWYGI